MPCQTGCSAPILTGSRKFFHATVDKLPEIVVTSQRGAVGGVHGDVEMREKMTIEAPWSVWATADQQEVDLLAVSLLDHPDVAAARSRALEAFRGSSEFGVADAPAGIDAAVDNLLFSCLQYAANDNPADPKIVWTVRLPYEVRDRTIPDSRYGADSPDRVYRVSGVGPEHRYEI